jgi:arylsulfatase
MQPASVPRAFAGILLAVLALSVAGGCAPEGRPGSGRGLLVIAFDGLRADRVSGLGYDRRTTPFLDALAADDAVLFDSLIAAAPQLVPAHAALLTGCDPNLARRQVPQWMDASLEQPWYLPPATPRLALSLATEGWRTLGVFGHGELGPSNGFVGGFQDVRDTWTLTRAAAGRPGIERGGAALLQWLRTLGQDDDWFAYVHASDLDRTWETWDPLWDNHFEHRSELRWVPPTGSTDPSLFALAPSRSMEGSPTMAIYDARFDGQLRRVDEELKRLFDNLRRLGRWEDTTVAIVGSFGMQFGEAGLLCDHGRLSMADLRVPLWLRAPKLGSDAAGRRDSGIASTIDLAPTLLDLVGVDALAPMQGRSLVPRMRGEEDPRGVVLASCGIQAGLLAADDDLALEITLPNVAPSDALVRAWYGDDQPRFRMDDSVSAQTAGSERRSYPWRLEPFPALDRAWPDLPGTTDLLVASQAWLADADALRRRVHAVDADVLTLLELEALMQEASESQQSDRDGGPEGAAAEAETSGGDEQP